MKNDWRRFNFGSRMNMSCVAGMPRSHVQSSAPQGGGTCVEDGVDDLGRDALEVGLRSGAAYRADCEHAQIGAAADDARCGGCEDGRPCVRTYLEPADVPARAAALVEVPPGCGTTGSSIRPPPETRQALALGLSAAYQRPDPAAEVRRVRM